MDDPLPPSILIVEDDQFISELIQLALKPDSYFFRRVADGRTGVELAKREKPDLIMMDVMMPGMDGHTAAAELATDESTRDIPIIIMTAKKGMRDAFSLSPNIVDFLEKPFDTNDLRNRVIKALSSRPAR